MKKQSSRWRDGKCSSSCVQSRLPGGGRLEHRTLRGHVGLVGKGVGSHHIYSEWVQTGVEECILASVRSNYCSEGLLEIVKEEGNSAWCSFLEVEKEEGDSAWCSLGNKNRKWTWKGKSDKSDGGKRKNESLTAPCFSPCMQSNLAASQEKGHRRQVTPKSTQPGQAKRSRRWFLLNEVTQETSAAQQSTLFILNKCSLIYFLEI